MSDFNYQSDYSGTSVTHDPRVSNAPFGDGYQQRVADGINNDPQVWDIVFVRTVAQINSIDTLLQGYGGVTSFTWTPYGHSEVRVICPKWVRNKTAWGADTLSAQFQQVFEP